MGRLIAAEFRKILTTKLWWALLIPAVGLALGWAWLSAIFFTDVANEIEDALDVAGINDAELSLSSLALTRAMNFATLFPMTFGALALASEINRKTITTSFLTAPSRASVLGAKGVVYTVWGLVYGIVVALAASLGVLIGTDGALPSAGDWIIILLTGILSCILWTLLGMGVGALLGSPVATLVILLLYAALVGPVAELIITVSTEGSNIAGVMPNGSANGLTGSTAAQLLFDQIQSLVGDQPTPQQREDFDTIARAGAGAPGAFSLWISGLIFVGWTALFFVTGLIRNQRRDIT
ncbi:MAG TPA: ABC transporter permease subunit [Actinophytocola sp.]|jgi:ABC-2 type transport system permease protein|uniref:ABC transporter permease subunit n=1 Tax=Actinophytocola sp. TaxID=1872138 RepID=UPI002F922FD6